MLLVYNHLKLITVAFCSVSEPFISTQWVDPLPQSPPCCTAMCLQQARHNKPNSGFKVFMLTLQLVTAYMSAITHSFTDHQLNTIPKYTVFLLGWLLWDGGLSCGGGEVDGSELLAWLRRLGLMSVHSMILQRSTCFLCSSALCVERLHTQSRQTNHCGSCRHFVTWWPP